MKKLYFTEESRREARNLKRRVDYPSKVGKEDYIERIPESGCWIWMGQTWRTGYGYLRIGNPGKHIAAHRYMYKLYKGDFNPKLHVLHTCDVPSCVNPNHLYLGTHTDNMQDMVKKGRKSVQRGDKNGNYKHGKYVKNKDI